MRNLTENFLDYLTENFSVVKTGSNQVKLSGGACPFCNADKKDLRLYISSQTGVGICFHCNTGFSPVSFVMEAEGCSRSQALNILNSNESAFLSKKSEEIALNEKTIFPQVILISKDNGLNYLIERNVTPEMIRHFNLFYCKNDTKIGERIYQTKERIVIPIYDLSANLTSWQARAVRKDVSPKYMFPPKFKGAELIYNAHNINKGEDIIVCEGVFDVFGWFKSGFKNSIATFGKKISKHQLDILKSLKPRVVYMAWDDDAQSEKEEFAKKFQDFFEVRIVSLPKDSDELTTIELTDCLNNAKKWDWSTYLTSILKFKK